MIQRSQKIREYTEMRLVYECNGNQMHILLLDLNFSLHITHIYIISLSISFSHTQTHCARFA